MPQFRLPFDPHVAELNLVNFIREYHRQAGIPRLVLGMSGGVDSATAASIAVRALGAENLTAFMMPFRTSSEASFRDAEAQCRALGVAYHLFDITPEIDAYFTREPDASPGRLGNKCARERMSVLYDQAAKLNAMVLGTGNRTEALLGYTTLWGDMASAYTVLGSLFKTQVWEFADYLGVLPEIVHKPPTADLWPGQTDESELGLRYREVDILLYRLFEEKRTVGELQEMGYSRDYIADVQRKVDGAAFKRRMPLAPDWRG